MPVAPEWTVGEVLLAAAYRKLLLGFPEGDVDREQIDKHLLVKLEPEELWHHLLTKRGGLASPRPARERLGLKQLMPIVPEISLYSGAVGKKRKGRWEPGRLLISAIQSGAGPDGWYHAVSSLQNSLRVGPDDDLLAQFLEAQLRKVRSVQLPPEPPSQFELHAPAWRHYQGGQRTPAESFVRDLQCLQSLKGKLTRRQWTVLMEALLRLGLGTHMLWICRLNAQVWSLILEALEQRKRPEVAEVERRCWGGHGLDDPLLELGGDAGRMIKRRISGYAQARIGINVVLHALSGITDAQWTSPIGVSNDTNVLPSQRLADFLGHVANHAPEIEAHLQSSIEVASVRQFAGTIADANSQFLRADGGTTTKNLYEFLIHTLVEMNVAKEDVEMSSYDQAYIAFRQRGKADNAPKYVRPGPAALIGLVSACCHAQQDILASLEDFRDFLAGYGISAPVGELQAGATGRNLEALGLVVDSPDAGGGRLLVDPF